MAKITATVLAARKSANGMYPIFVRIAAKKEKAYIKTQYELSDLCQWYNGKVVSCSDTSLMNKRILFEIKKYKERIEEIENYDTYTATQLKFIISGIFELYPLRYLSTYNKLLSEHGAYQI